MDACDYPMDAAANGSGFLYVACHDEIVGLDPDGGVIWQEHHTDGFDWFHDDDVAVTNDGGAVVVGYDWMKRFTPSGSRLFVTSVPTAPITDHHNRVVAFLDGRLFASGYAALDGAWAEYLTADGDEIWRRSLDTERLTVLTPVAAAGDALGDALVGGVAYGGGTSAADDRFGAWGTLLDADGNSLSELREFEDANHIRVAEVAPAPDGGFVMSWNYEGTPERFLSSRVVGLDRAGHERFRYDGGFEWAGAMLVDADGNTLGLVGNGCCAFGERYLVSIAPSGAERWRAPFGQGVGSIIAMSWGAPGELVVLRREEGEDLVDRYFVERYAY
jgi:hypothetical protein